MEVGANLIARTAHAALTLIAELSERLKTEIDLAWLSNWPGRIAAIEVYPAATRITLGVPRGSGSLVGFERRVRYDGGAAPASKDARDAVVCAIAAAEFLAGRAIAPTNGQEAQAKQEGWIWAGPAPTGSVGP